MKERFDSYRLKISLTLMLLVMVLIACLSLDVFTLSRYETTISSTNNIATAIYLLNDEYQTVSVRLPDVIPSNNQYIYTFSVSNYTEDRHSDTNIKYVVHIRTTTNMPIEYDLFNTLDIDGGEAEEEEEEEETGAESCVVSDDFIPDSDGTIFRHIYSDEKVMLYSEDELEYYTLLFTFPDDYTEHIYNGLVDYIEINIESRQILNTDV